MSRARQIITAVAFSTAAMTAVGVALALSKGF